jgi:hypothetical protein
MAFVVSLVLTFAAGLVRNATPEEPEKPSVQSVKKPTDSDDDFERLRPKVKLGKVPVIELAPRDPMTKEKVARIKACIARLADINGPDFGLSATMSGQAFLPLPDQRQSHVMIITDHRLKSSAALKTLVEMGPDALPFLLDALGDKTPTKFKLEHRSASGDMRLGHELWGNPANDAEMKALGPPMDREEARKKEKHIDSYTVKVGDACLVAIGQIVGRGYQAVRYQPTACVVINSPTEDEKLREQVRKVWTGDDPARKLLNALLLDYATEGVFQGPSLDSWGLGSELQIQAAMRLLYYYPKETTSLVAERLRKLDVSKTSNHGNGSPATEKELDAYIRREVANGVRTDEFVKAVSWCSEKKVREAIRDIFAKTDDIDVLLASLRGIDGSDSKLINERLQKFLDTVPKEEGGPYGDGYNLLVAFAEHFGKDAAPSFDRYLRDASAQRCHSATQALQDVKGEWFIPLLVRLLDDKRPVKGYTYAVQSKDQDKRLPIRVCDAAAETLHQHRPELQFALEGEYKDLDEQINAIRGKLGAKQN